MHSHPDAHSFVLRIWLEDAATEASQARWRGRITNVLDERTRVVQQFDQFEEFVQEYVNQWTDPAPDT